LRRWDSELVSLKHSLEAVGKMPELRIICRSKGADLFPITNAVEKMAFELFPLIYGTILTAIRSNQAKSRP